MARRATLHNYRSQRVTFSLPIFDGLTALFRLEMDWRERMNKKVLESILGFLLQQSEI
jgi:hypothetical protein